MVFRHLTFFNQGSVEQYLGAEKGALSLPVSIGIGGVTGVLYWFSVFGLDTLKTRIMQDTVEAEPKFKSIGQCYRAVMEERNGKISRLIMGPGLTAALLRAFPTNAVMLGSYAFLGKYFNLT